MRRLKVSLLVVLFTLAAASLAVSAVLDDGPPFASKHASKTFRWCWLCRPFHCDCPED